uniref:Exostosin-2 n=4 Tax=Lygus hesperus TaxID=30085 RepID=A0A146KMH8_LYGHE
MGSKHFTALSGYKRFFIGLFAVLIVSFLAIVSGLVNLFPRGLVYSKTTTYDPLDLSDPTRSPRVVIPSDTPVSSGPNPKCTYYDCFNVYKCGHKGAGKILVYVYPLKYYVSDKGVPIVGSHPMSREFYSLLSTIVESRYYTPNPEEACVFVVSIDTLNQNRIKIKEASQALTLLPFWSNGDNHLIFNMVAGAAPEYNTVVDLAIGNAMVAGAGFDSWSYRVSFDVSLPLFSTKAVPLRADSNTKRKWLIISSQLNINSEYTSELLELASDHSELLVLQPCETPVNKSVRCVGQSRTYFYPQVLQQGEFCIVLRGLRLAQTVLMDAMAAGCIPIVIANTMIMPFAEVLDWKRASLRLNEADLGTVVTLAESISPGKRRKMRDQCLWLYSKYFSSMKAITSTTLDILNDRVYPQNAMLYEDWNNPPHLTPSSSPLFLELTAPRWQGFTAVVLTYDRVDSLFSLIEKLVKVPSLSKVLVVWNNQRKSPPPSAMWPKVTKPLKVIQTKANKLSNRFYPYEDIETEAILTIDDDIVMLTSDELEFGYEVWREFPDRIVGFPSRFHVWDNATGRWKYESEWTNQISMVLTGAAFHHKYWSYMYTTSMPGNIKEWVDDHMNCEDIAMNFLVANVTNKAPIKVTPRKKFKCPECTQNEMLSADLNHMIERSQCIDRFAAIYGQLPLRTVEFRADPVLYKDVFPEKLKRFNNIGSL